MAYLNPSFTEWYEDADSKQASGGGGAGGGFGGGGGGGGGGSGGGGGGASRLATEAIEGEAALLDAWESAGYHPLAGRSADYHPYDGEEAVAAPVEVVAAP